ncbi:hypothetical protein VTK26DRAFT_8827 [Humicola hyalothermophila]
MSCQGEPELGFVMMNGEENSPGQAAIACSVVRSAHHIFPRPFEGRARLQRSGVLQAAFLASSAHQRN